MNEALESLVQKARAKGTDKQFREWVQRQPSCLTGKWSEWLDDIGEWRNPACHVRRGGKSGTAYKEPFACIPLTHAEHDYQHHHGERACLEHFLGGNWTAEQAKDFFDEQRIRYLKLWLES